MPDQSTPAPFAEDYDNARPKMRGGHLDGEMHGEWTWYRRDGSVMRTGSFDRGRQVATWRTWDRGGNVIKETVFPPAVDVDDERGGAAAG